MNDDDPDYPALCIAGTVFGGSPNSRIFHRIRVKDGLSYGANAGFNMPTKDDGGRFSAIAIAAPQNVPKVEADFKDELAKALKDGFTADEVEKAKKTWLDERTVARAEEASIASLAVPANAGAAPWIGTPNSKPPSPRSPRASQRRLPQARRPGHHHHRESRRLPKSRRLSIANSNLGVGLKASIST